MFTGWEKQLRVREMEELEVGKQSPWRSTGPLGQRLRNENGWECR